MTLALECPPRELVFAPTLDVGSRAGGRDLVDAGAPAHCDGSAAPVAAPFMHRDAATVATLHVSLSHSTLVFEPAALHVSPPSCRTAFVAHGGAAGISAAVRGGTLRASTPEQMRVRCSCERAGTANLTVTLGVRDATRPVFWYLQACPAARPRAAWVARSPTSW